MCGTIADEAEFVVSGKVDFLIVPVTLEAEIEVVVGFAIEADSVDGLLSVF